MAEGIQNEGQEQMAENKRSKVPSGAFASDGGGLVHDHIVAADIGGV